MSPEARKAMALIITSRHDTWDAPFYWVEGSGIRELVDTGYVVLLHKGAFGHKNIAGETVYMHRYRLSDTLGRNAFFLTSE